MGMIGIGIICPCSWIGYRMCSRIRGIRSIRRNRRSSKNRDKMILIISIREMGLLILAAILEIYPLLKKSKKKGNKNRNKK